MRYKKLLLCAALAAVTVATTLALGLTRPHAAAAPQKERAAVVETASPLTVQTETPPSVDEYIQREIIGPRLRSAFVTIGDRLEKPGKERLVMTGTLTLAGETASTAFTMVREFSDRLRLETRDGEQSRVSVYNRRAAQHNNRSRRAAEVVETLTFDTAEHFFTAHAGGAAMRHLGDRFRLDGGGIPDTAAPNASYNVYEVTEEVETGGDALRRQTKIYAFNSDTLLLERVRYEIERDGETVRVEVRLEKWQRVQGQMLPMSIERRENDALVLSLDISSVIVGPKQDDAIFTATTGSN